MKVRIRITESGDVFCDAYSDEYIKCDGWKRRGTRCDECPLVKVWMCQRD